MSAGKKLLIIDDDPDFVDGIRSILRTAEYEVDVAYNPKDGFQSFANQALRPTIARHHDGKRRRRCDDRPEN